MPQQLLGQRSLRPNLAAIDFPVEMQGEAAAAELEQTIGRLIEQGVTWVVASCTKLEFMDVACANALTAHWVRLQRAGGNIVLCDLYESMAELLLKRYGLNADGPGTMGWFGTEEQAVAHAQHPQTRVPDNYLEVRSAQSGDFRVVALEGALYEARGIALLGQAIQEGTRAGCRGTVLDCNLMPSISLPGFGALLAALNATARNLRLSGVWGPPRVFLEATGAAAMFPMHASVPEALAAFR